MGTKKQSDLTILSHKAAQSIADLQHWRIRADQLAQSNFLRKRSQLDKSLAEEKARAKADYDRSFLGMKQKITRFGGDLRVEELPWSSAAWNDYRPSDGASLPGMIRIGSFYKNGQFGTLELPALMPLLTRRLVLMLARGNASRNARQLLHSLVLRYLMTLTPGKLRLRCIDPVEKGAAFGVFFKTLPANLTTGQIAVWEKEIERCVSELEKTVQARLNQIGERYDSFEDYLAEQERWDEPYILLAISDYPRHFTELASKRLSRITALGKKCGVFTLLMVDSDTCSPSHEATLEDMKKAGIVLQFTGNGCEWQEETYRSGSIEIDPPPGPEDARQLLNRIRNSLPGKTRKH